MNNSSSWNCFSWNRRAGNSPSNDGLSGGGSSKKTPIKQIKGEIPDEQFANLLGGECAIEDHNYILLTLKTQNKPNTL
jgi:hypothetical protein